MTSGTFIIEGDVNVSVTITELPDGSLQFDLAVLDDTGSIGDLNAFFFDLADDSLTDGLYVTGDDVTDVAFKADGVTKIDSYTNMNGEVVKDLGKFDGGVQFGTQGIGEDDIRETSFTLTHDTEVLTLADFDWQDFGIRLTSVGEEDGPRDGSLKIGSESTELVTVTEPEPEPEPTPIATDDTMTVNEYETFNTGFIPFDHLANLAESVLANDTSDSMPYLGGVTAVNGETADVGEIVIGSNGGAIRIFADGTVDFSAYSTEGGPSDFGYLEDGQSAQTTFDYQIEGGSTATLTVTVNGVSDYGGPDGPPPLEDF